MKLLSHPALIGIGLAIVCGVGAGVLVDGLGTSHASIPGVASNSHAEIFMAGENPADAARSAAEFTGIDALLPVVMGNERIVAFRGRKSEEGSRAIVEVYVQGDTGGYLLTQSTDNIEPGPDWIKVGQTALGEVWKSGIDGWREYYFLDPSRPDIVVSLSPYSQRTDADVLGILGGTLE